MPAFEMARRREMYNLKQELFQIKCYKAHQDDDRNRKIDFLPVECKNVQDQAVPKRCYILQHLGNGRSLPDHLVKQQLKTEGKLSVKVVFLFEY